MRAPTIMQPLALCLSALLLSPLAHAETATLQHDNNGNVTQRTTPLGTTTYQFDALNRMIGESGPAKTQTITYDENGNRKSDGAGSYVYETTSNRMSTRLGLAVSYDVVGNLTADGTGRTLTYNQANQLYRVFQGGVLLATYVYDYRGLRVGKVTTASAPQGAQTVIYEYDEQEHLISEISGTNAPLRTYVWRDNTPVAQIEHTSGTDKTLSFDRDHLNTPRAAMDETGKVVWRWESDAFGTTLPDEDPDKDGVKTTINLRFGGVMYYDQESGLFYNGHRYYNPATGQYTQPDRLDVVRRAVNPLYRQYSEPTDLQRALNQPFTYASNNPMSYVDPLGLREMYGNWGGSNWSGGKSGPRIPSNPLSPTDSLDACFMMHDYCYQKNEDNGQCSVNGPSKNIEKACDMALLQCMANLPSNTKDWPIPPKNLVYGDNQHNPTADTFRSQADTYFRWKWHQ